MYAQRGMTESRISAPASHLVGAGDGAGSIGWRVGLTGLRPMEVTVIETRRTVRQLRAVHIVHHVEITHLVVVSHTGTVARTGITEL